MTRDSGTFASSVPISAGNDNSAIVADARPMGLGEVSPRQNTSKIAVPFVELNLTPGFSTTFSTVVEILGEKPKVRAGTGLVPLEHESNKTGDCSTGNSGSPNRFGIWEFLFTIEVSSGPGIGLNAS
jgi:hypothetical protein